LIASNDEAPSAVIQVSQPNVGIPYAPQRGGSGSPSMMQAAQQYAAGFQQQQQQQQQQFTHQEQLHYEQQQQYAEHEHLQDPVATGTSNWTQEPEMAQMYGNNGYNEENQKQQGGYVGYAAAEGVPEMANDPAQQYYDNQHFNQEQQYDGNAAYEGNGADMDAAYYQDHMNTYFAGRKLPPPAVSFESPIKAKFARGAAHSSARSGALAGAFNKAAMTTGVPQLQPPQGPFQMPTAGAAEDDGYTTGAGMNENQMMMHGYPSGGFAGSSVASAPAGEESGNGGQVEQQQQQQQGEEEHATAEAPLPPPKMGAPGGMVGGNFPTFGSKPGFPRKESTQSQPGSARSTGNGPPQFGTQLSPRSGVFMASNNNNNNNANNNNNNTLASKESIDGVVSDQQRKNSNSKPKKQRRRGLCSVVFTISLVLLLTGALSVGTTIVAVTFASNMTHAAIIGLGNVANGASLSSAIAKMHPAAVGVATHVDEISHTQWIATERSFKCDESNPACRGTRWLLHSARLVGILTRDGAILTASHAPHIIKKTSVLAVHFTKKQSALLFDQLKGMKTREGRDAVVAAIHQSAGEVKRLGRDLFVWVNCVYQHLNQSGVHSIHHVVEPAAGCWIETMGHYYLPDDGGNASGRNDDREITLLKEREEEEREITAPVENRKATAETEKGVVIEKEPVEQAEEGLLEAVVLEKKKEEEEQEQELEPSPGATASSPMALELDEEEKKQENVEIKVNDQEFNADNAVEAVGAPTPVETEKVIEEVDLPATANTTTIDVSSPEVETKTEVPDNYENIIEDEEEVKEVPPSFPVDAPFVPGVAEEIKVEGEQRQKQEEVLSITPETSSSEVVVDATTTKNTPSSELPERYASEEEYMMGHGEPAAEENEKAVEEEEEEEAADGSGIDGVKDGVTDQGPPGASISSQTTATQSTQKKPLWSIKGIGHLQEIKNKLAGAEESLRAHQSSIVAALCAAGGTAIFFVASNALAARKAAAVASRLASGAGAQQVTPRRPFSAAEEAPATVFKSARSKRKTKPVVSTSMDEEGDGLLKKSSRQSAPARLAAPAFEAVEPSEVKQRGRKSSRGGASTGRSLSRGGAATLSRGRTATAPAGGSSRGGRKASVSRHRSTKPAA
jgi:hypothetical protein